MLGNETRWLGNEARLLGNETGWLGNEARLLGNETRWLGNETGYKLTKTKTKCTLCCSLVLSTSGRL